MNTRSGFLDIHLSEAWRSVIRGFIGAALLGFVTLIDGGKHIPTFHEVWLLLWAAGATTAGNILGIFFTNSKGQQFKSEPDATVIPSETKE